MLLRSTSKVILLVVSTTFCLALFQNCSGGFEPLRLNENSVFDFASLDQGKILYKTNCSTCHGPLESSSKIGKTVTDINRAIATIPQMSKFSFLTQRERTLIAAVLSPTAPTTDPLGRQIFACTPGQIPKTPATKLTNREFAFALNSLLDDFSGGLKNDGTLIQMLNSLPIDVLGADRDTLKEQSLLISRANVSATFEATFRAGYLITTDANGLQNYPNTGGCLAGATITQNCHKLFVQQLATKAFRRSLSQAEIDGLAASIFDSSLSKSDLLQSTFALIVSMPDFTYKVYDQGTLQSGSSVLTLNATEIANKLAFFLMGTTPDAALKSKADSGAILDPTVLSQEVDRLLTLPLTRNNLHRLFRESYGYDVFPAGWDFDSTYIGGHSMNGMKTLVTKELDDYFTSVIVDQHGSFNDLMTSTWTSFYDPNASYYDYSTLAYIYGVSYTAGPANASITLPPERAGFLNRAAMLTKTPGYLTSPIKRGLKVLEHVLCEQVGDPPPNAPANLPDLPAGQYMTVRDRTHALSEAPGSLCITCHTNINNLGYQFEKFDSFGRVRTNESVYDSRGQIVATLPLNTQAYTSEVNPPNSISTADSLELTQKIGVSQKAIMCFTQELKRFESRIPASADANCQMNRALEALYGSNGTQGAISDAIKAYVLSPEFKSWNFGY